MKKDALTILLLLLNFSLLAQHNGDFTITDGSLIMTNSSNTGLLNISGQIGRNFNMSSYRPVQNELITRLGINFAIHGSNGQTQYAIIGNKKSPFIELNAENGSISIFGENGSGSNWRTSNSSSSLGISVDMNGMVGIGLTDPASKLEVGGDIALARSYKIKFLETVGGGDRAYIRSTNGEGGDYNSLVFAVGAGDESMTVKHNGNVGIGTNSPQSKLAVNGQIRATEVKVLTDVNSVPDYVFEPDYNLRTLKETKEYITENKHLPEIPSASEIGENGIDLGDMNMRLLKKIEELTLHLIEQNERVEKLEKEVSTLKNK